MGIGLGRYGFPLPQRKDSYLSGDLCRQAARFIQRVFLTVFSTAITPSPNRFTSVCAESMRAPWSLDILPMAAKPAHPEPRGEELIGIVRKSPHGTD